MGNDDKADGNVPTGKSEEWHDYDKPGDFRMIRDETPPKTGAGKPPPAVTARGQIDKLRRMP